MGTKICKPWGGLENSRILDVLAQYGKNAIPYSVYEEVARDLNRTKQSVMCHTHSLRRALDIKCKYSGRSSTLTDAQKAELRTLVERNTVFSRQLVADICARFGVTRKMVLRFVDKTRKELNGTKEETMELRQNNMKPWTAQEEGVVMDLIQKYGNTAVPLPVQAETAKALGRTHYALKTKLVDLRMALGVQVERAGRALAFTDAAVKDAQALTTRFKRVPNRAVSSFCKKHGHTHTSARALFYRLRHAYGELVPLVGREEIPQKTEGTHPLTEYKQPPIEQVLSVEISGTDDEIASGIRSLLAIRCEHCPAKNAQAANESLRVENEELRRVNNEQKELLIELKDLREAAYRFGKRGERVVNIT